MRRNQRSRDFYRSTAFLDGHEHIRVVKEMERSGCLLLQAPLSLLLALAAALCWLVYAASSVQLNPSPTFTPMLVLGGFLRPTTYIAARVPTT